MTKFKLVWAIHMREQEEKRINFSLPKPKRPDRISYTAAAG